MRDKPALTEIMGVKLYIIPEVAEMLKVSTRTVQAYISDKRIPAQRIGGKWYITEPNLKRFIEGEA